MGMGSISGSCESSYTVSSSFHIHMHGSVHKETIHRPPGLSVQLSSLALCPVTFTCLSSADSRQCLLTVKSLLGSSSTGFTVLWPGNYLKEVIWGNGKAHLIFSPALRHHQCCLMFSVMKTGVSYILSVFLLF